jgi:UrcA family protein
MARVTSIWINVATFLLALAWQGHAAAAGPTPSASTETHSTTVHFADLNLDQPAAVAALYQRINAAAGQVCGEPRLTGSHFVSSDWVRCVSQAVDRAVITLDRPELNAYHQTHIPSHTVATIARPDSRS